MFTPREIRDTEFERIVRGYNPEDVDGFLAQIADQIEQLEADKAASDKKLMLLAEKVDEMREDEGRLRSVLISAEKMKEEIINKANEEAQGLVNDATQRAEVLLADAQARYDSIVGEISTRSAQEEDKLHSLKTEVAGFKNSILATYKQHLELIKSIPDSDYDDASAVTASAPVVAVEETAPVMVAEMVSEAVALPQIEETVEVAPFSFGQFEEPAEKIELNEVKPASSDSAFNAFMADDDANERFGKLDFGESFTFGKE